MERERDSSNLSLVIVNLGVKLVNITFVANNANKFNTKTKIT